VGKLRGLSLEWWLSIGIVGAVVLTIGVVLLVHVVDPPTYLERLAHDAGFDHNPYDCFDVVRRPDPKLLAQWPSATETATIFCDTSKNDPFNNGSLAYVRFADPSARRAAVARRKPEHRACVFDDRLLLDEDAPRFAKLCAEHHGQVLPGPVG
jgi:hypothetical protein